MHRYSVAADTPNNRAAAGHSVEVLLKTYVKCLDGHEEVARRRVQAALGFDS